MWVLQATCSRNYIWSSSWGKLLFSSSFFSSSPSIPLSSALWMLTQSHKGVSGAYLQPCHSPSPPTLSLLMGLPSLLFTTWKIPSHLSRPTSNANSLYNSPRSSPIIILYKALLFKRCPFYKRAICLYTYDMPSGLWILWGQEHTPVPRRVPVPIKCLCIYHFTFAYSWNNLRLHLQRALMW